MKINALKKSAAVAAALLLSGGTVAVVVAQVAAPATKPAVPASVPPGPVHIIGTSVAPPLDDPATPGLTLPNGTRIVPVGVASAARFGDGWWAIDGTPLDAAPAGFERFAPHKTDVPGSFVVAFRNVYPADSMRMSFGGTTEPWTAGDFRVVGWQPPADGGIQTEAGTGAYVQHEYLGITPGPTSVQVDLRLQVGGGPAQLIESIDRAGGVGGETRKDESGRATVEWDAPAERDGAARVRLVSSDRRYAYNVAAVTTTEDGTEARVDGTEASHPDTVAVAEAGGRALAFDFPGLSLARVKRFELTGHVTSVALVRHVSLRRGEATEPALSVAPAPDAPPAGPGLP